MFKNLLRIICGLSLLLLSPFYGASAEVNTDLREQKGDSIVRFKFMARNETFWASYKGNEREFVRLANFIQHNRQILMTEQMPILVDGYCTSFPDVELNKSMGKQRSNHVKSYVIMHHGLKESNFKTVNHITPYVNGETDVVVLSFRIQAKDVKKLVTPEVEEPEEVVEVVEIVEKKDNKSQFVQPPVAETPHVVAPAIAPGIPESGSLITPKPAPSILEAPDVVVKNESNAKVKPVKEKVKKERAPKEKKVKQPKKSAAVVAGVGGATVVAAPIIIGRGAKAERVKPIKTEKVKPVKVEKTKPVKAEKAKKEPKVKQTKQSKKSEVVGAATPVNDAEKVKPVKVEKTKPVKTKKEDVKIDDKKSIANRPVEYEITATEITKKLKESNKVYKEQANIREKLVKTKTVKSVPEKKTNRFAFVPKNNFSFELKTNLLYWIATAPNIEAEVLFKQRVGLNLEYQYAGTEFDNGAKRLRVTMFSPELRYYLIPSQLFIGAYYGTGMYNFKFSEFGYQGAFNGGGITVGYKLPIGKALALEFALSGGYAWTQFDKYQYVDGCNRFVQYNGLNYFGPTKAKVSLIWRIGGAK